MFDRFKRSMDLIKASATVLRQDTHLLVFPLISGIAAMLVALGFVLPAFGLDLLGDEPNEPLLYSGLFLFYVTQYFVIFYFNVALVGATMIRMDGGTPTIGDGLRIANARIGNILGYAVIAATVGVILQTLQERLGFVGRIIVGMIGVGWTVATALVVPVLVARDKGPIDAIKDSAQMFRQTWGENVIGQVGMSFAFTMLYMAWFLGGAGLLGLGLYLGSPFLVALVVVAGVLGFLFLCLVQVALGGIYSAALYRYASGGSASTGFDNGALQAAFVPKN